MLLRGPQIESASLTTAKMAIRPGQTGATAAVPIDLTATGTTTLATIAAGEVFNVVGVWLEATAADTITVAPRVTVGAESSTSNIFAETELVGLNTVGEVYVLWQLAGKGVLASDTTIDLEVTVAATATSLDVNAYVVGFMA